MELYDLDAFQNIKLKQPLYDKRRKVINCKNEFGDPGIEGFWLQVFLDFWIFFENFGLFQRFWGFSGNG
jgi:hypothetical protein